MFTINTNYSLLQKLAVCLYNLRGPNKSPAAFHQNPAMSAFASSEICATSIKLAATMDPTNVFIAALLVELVGNSCSPPSPGSDPDWSTANKAVLDALETLGLRPQKPNFDVVGDLSPSHADALMRLAIASAKPTKTDVETLLAGLNLVPTWSSSHRARKAEITALDGQIPQPAPEHPCAWIIEKASSLSTWQTQIILDAKSNTRQQAWDRFLAVKKANPNETFRFTALYPQ